VVAAGVADLSVVKLVDQPSASLGQTVVFTVAVHNAGPSIATNVRVTDVLPGGLTFVSDSATSGAYDVPSGAWAVGTRIWRISHAATDRDRAANRSNRQWCERHLGPVGSQYGQQLGAGDTERSDPVTYTDARSLGQLAVGRLGARSDADLGWETELLQHLDREGLTVPVPIPTTDGRLFAEGLVVMSYVEGGPPETEADWRRVADTLRRLHRSTQLAAASGLAVSVRAPAEPLSPSYAASCWVPAAISASAQSVRQRGSTSQLRGLIQSSVTARSVLAMRTAYVFACGPIRVTTL
jgi:uncharacterized repeat protein (TIGR01451 family)